MPEPPTAPTAPSELDDFLARPKALWIDGASRSSGASTRLESIDPSSGTRIAEVETADPGDVDVAVGSARAALSGPWARLSPDERGRLLWRLADLIEVHADELAALEALDNGKPITAARAEDIPLGAEMFRYYAGWSTKWGGRTVPVSEPGFHVHTVREPVGVCAAIIPWNYPMMMATWKLAPALACGNVMIVKPAEQTPLSMLRLAELTADAGFPPGVVTVLNGVGEVTGRALAEHEGVDKVAFTGSTEVGRAIARAATGNLKRVSLELGGKSPNIVFADADRRQRSEGAFWGLFANMGQDCTAGSRLFVESSIYDETVADLVRRAEALRIGPGSSPDTEMGPVVSDEQMTSVLARVHEGVAAGATVACGGSRARVAGGEDGFFVEPTVLTDVTPDMAVAREEIFGPVVVVQRFDDEDEVVARANDTEFGLAAGVWTRDVGRAHRVSSALRAGTVWINTYGNISPGAPFGGYKQSGWGREMGDQALELYSEVKSVWSNVAPL